MLLFVLFLSNVLLKTVLIEAVCLIERDLVHGLQIIYDRNGTGIAGLHHWVLFWSLTEVELEGFLLLVEILTMTVATVAGAAMVALGAIVAKPLFQRWEIVGSVP